MIAALSLLSAPQTAPTSLPADARLDRSLAVEARIEPLPELLATMSRECGATLAVERKMAALKATVLVAARPVRRTMADLASVFDAQWTPIEGGYRLEMSIPKRNLLERYIDVEDKERRAATESFWRACAKYAKAPWEQMTIQRDDARRARDEFHSMSDPGFAEADLRYRALNGLAQPGSEYLLARLLGTLSEKEWDALRGGRAYYASSTAKRGAIALPKDSVTVMNPTFSPTEGQNDPSVRVFFRLNPVAGDAEWVARWGSAASRGKRAAFVGDANLKTHPFRRALDAWSTDPEAGKAPELDRPLKTVEPLPSPWASPWANESDTLAELHRQSGLDLVAEGSRRASRRAPGGLREVTVRTALANWETLGNVRLEDGAVLYRPDHYWSRRATEPPEAALRRWETRPDGGLDAMADLATAVTPAQAALLDTMTARKSTQRIPSAYSILRVWGLLTATERARLQAGTPFPLSAMSDRAREAAIVAMIDGIFEGAVPTDRMLAIFDAPWNQATLDSLSLFLSTTELGSGRPIEANEWRLSAPAGTDERLSKLPAVPGVHLELGSAPGEGLVFTVPR